MGLVTDEAGLRRTVGAWIADDPDESDRAELRGLLDEADEGVTDAVAELRDRFADRLHFGTAGLRGVVAAGPNRMNRAVVRAATAAVAGWLLAPDPARAGMLRSPGSGSSAIHASTAFRSSASAVTCLTHLNLRSSCTSRPIPAENSVVEKGYAVDPVHDRPPDQP